MCCSRFNAVYLCFTQKGVASSQRKKTAIKYGKTDQSKVPSMPGTQSIILGPFMRSMLVNDCFSCYLSHSDLFAVLRQ